MRVMDDNIFRPFAEIDFSRVLDNRSIVDFKCPQCHGTIRIHEATLNGMQKDRFDMMVNNYYRMIESIHHSVIEVYGEDPRNILLMEKLDKIRRQFAKPDLKVVKGE